MKELRTHLYGNYVVSHVLEFGDLQDRSKIIDEILDDLVELSLHKFGSNVVEKCLLHSPADRKPQIVDGLVSVPVNGGQFTISDMMNSKYGNFVVQKVFSIADKAKQEILLIKIDHALKLGKVNMRKAPAKHIFSCLEREHNVKFDPNLYPGQTLEQEPSAMQKQRKSNPKPSTSNKGRPQNKR
jgi:hypothetical protein